jgi:Protein of unknown function (DUF2459).
LSGDWQAFYAGAAIIELRLVPAAYGRLLDFVSKTFSRPAPGDRAQAYPGLFAHSYFYPATRRFSLLRTCNGWVAEGARVSGPADRAQLCDHSGAARRTDRQA